MTFLSKQISPIFYFYLFESSNKIQIYSKALLLVIFIIVTSIQMCGNDLSTISAPAPDDEFRALVNYQIRSGRIAIKNVPLRLSNIYQFRTINTLSIKEIAFQKCKLTQESFDELLRISFPSLKVLNINDNEVGPIGCRILSLSPLASQLTQISMNNNKIKDVGVKSLAHASLDNLEDLSLNDNQLTIDGIAAFKGKVNSLECLSLGGNKINDQSISIMADLELHHLIFLKLSRNQITDTGIKEIVTKFTKLEVLLVERNKIKEGKDTLKGNNKELFLFY